MPLPFGQKENVTVFERLSGLGPAYITDLLPFSPLLVLHDLLNSCCSQSPGQEMK